MNRAVTEYVQQLKEPWQPEICTRLDEVISEAVVGIDSRLQYGKPHYLKNGKYAAVVGTAKDWVSFTIFNATGIDAPAGLFEPGPAERKTVKIRKAQAVDYGQLGELLQQAAATI